MKIFKVIIKDLFFILVVVLMLMVIFPIFAKEINEKNLIDLEQLKTVLPENKTIDWSGNLPAIQDKKKIKKIVIDLSEQKLYLYENNKIVGEYLVSTGKPSMETPTGRFKIYTKNKRQWSKMASLWMPYWMMIEPTKGIGIHELPEWPNGYKEGAEHLGQPVSHGCIRLGVGTAEKVYKWTELGMAVQIRE